MSMSTYDRKCYDLAVHFLSDHPDLDREEQRVRLAITIQAAIEDWFFATGRAQQPKAKT
jgi:hypothetical protein